MGVVGSGTYLTARDDPGAAPSPRRATTTTTLAEDTVAAAIARALEDGLEVPLTASEARCVADALLAVVRAEQLAELESLTEPLRSLDDAAHDQLVRGVVGCVPPETAGALLGEATTTTSAVQLPDEGG